MLLLELVTKMEGPSFVKCFVFTLTCKKRR